MKKRSKAIYLLLAAVMILSFTACGGSSSNESDTSAGSSNASAGSASSAPAEDTAAASDSAASDTAEAVTINTFDHEVTYEAAPERAVSIGYETVQELLALGLKDKIVACTSAHFKVEECLPEYADQLKELNTIGESIAFEALLAENPDFVYGHNWSFNEEGIASIEDFESNNIKYYVVKGSYDEMSTVDDVYEDVLNLGKIFRVDSKAEEVVAGMKARIAEVEKNKVSGSPTVFVYDSGDKQPYTAGKKALQSQLLEIAGGENLFNDIDKKYGEVSWEEVAKRNPQWILINEYEDENMTESKEKFLKENPALKNVDAVKNNHFISINLIELREGLQMVDGAEKIVEAFNAG
jgi:iron complex transport system substrate-binding protein